MRVFYTWIIDKSTNLLSINKKGRVSLVHWTYIQLKYMSSALWLTSSNDTGQLTLCCTLFCHLTLFLARRMVNPFKIASHLQTKWKFQHTLSELKCLLNRNSIKWWKLCLHKSEAQKKLRPKIKSVNTNKTDELHDKKPKNANVLHP